MADFQNSLRRPVSSILSSLPIIIIKQDFKDFFINMHLNLLPAKGKTNLQITGSQITATNTDHFR